MALICFSPQLALNKSNNSLIRFLKKFTNKKKNARATHKWKFSIVIERDENNFFLLLFVQLWFCLWEKKLAIHIFFLSFFWGDLCVCEREGERER